MTGILGGRGDVAQADGRRRQQVTNPVGVNEKDLHAERSSLGANTIAAI